MSSLASDLRARLQRAVGRARTMSEQAARTALDTLGVVQGIAPRTLSAEERRLRVALRSRLRQLGNDVDELVRACAYEQWHRMLFARFLAENDLLVHPEWDLSISLEDCEEIASSTPGADRWTIAADFASGMLPGIFRITDPLLMVKFAPEGRIALERVLDELTPEMFQSDDALGWVYQYWQEARKDEVNRSEVKIGSAELPAVTQLFTERYMVRFLLENTLGAWWVSRNPNSPLNSSFIFLRYLEDGTPASGKFSEWPDRAADLTCIDPCCGSGHFLIEMFDMLTAMRMEQESLDARSAGDAVLRDNLFGLEIDERCIEIAAFALMLQAWKRGGYRALPSLNLACSGIGVGGQLADWLRLAGDDELLRNGLQSLHELFQQAPTLGSLIDPKRQAGGLLAADWEKLEPLVSRALELEQDNPVAVVAGQAAASLAKAASLLAKQYHLVTTNVPYLTRRRQDDVLRKFCEQRYAEGKDDLAAAFVLRCAEMTVSGGAYGTVSPQNWTTLSSYEDMRRMLLKEQSFHLYARLGRGAFEAIGGAVVNVVLLIVGTMQPSRETVMYALDLTGTVEPSKKRDGLLNSDLRAISQDAQVRHPSSTILAERLSSHQLLGAYADSYAGIVSGDGPRFIRMFWEVPVDQGVWARFQTTTADSSVPYGGCSFALLWEDGNGRLRRFGRENQKRLHNIDQRGRSAWGKPGIAINQMNLQAAIYSGELFDSNVAIITPRSPEDFDAIWHFCRSRAYRDLVQKIDSKLNVTNATLVKVPFDIAAWRTFASSSPTPSEPYSRDPTQWLFDGVIPDALHPLQVAVARLCGYSWPDQKADGLDRNVDNDGIVCLPAVHGELSASDRLVRLLADAYQDKFHASLIDRLLADAGYSGRSLQEWLWTGFFSQHCKIFGDRPFIWHVTDGRKDGFSALLNYQALTRAKLEKLTYATLGSWIEQQALAAQNSVPGADVRLASARSLQEKLGLILDGEPPYDIYARWKAPKEQPIGWQPDLDDGVRINIRPFIMAKVLRHSVKVHWRPDRGKNQDGTSRINDLHLSIAEKQAARAIGSSSGIRAEPLHQLTLGDEAS
ncbi:Eco57I restriction-modification methylase domain-containing protein [Nonomuraea sp. LPB2021202275-12-8]|uniref:Eco57I restriction-modification methylase domain-containing protein n=1 Tax=Nonomuraea sp. LPB2021202275-12-8 TaxID=3120159 RepID=UPI00300C0210